MTVPPILQPYGDSALIALFGEEISESSYRRVQGLLEALKANPPPGLGELIPAYASLVAAFDPAATDYAAMEREVRNLAENAADSESPRVRVARVPVCYESAHAPDLEDVARHAGLCPEDVVSIHSSKSYLVYMLGFTPGFPYLGGLDERIAAPRRASPRTKVPAGAVGIADRQTGVYPLESPGGWNIIGRTPAILFDPFRTPPALLAPGMYIRFFPISCPEFSELAAAAEADRWRPEIVEEERR